jgi:hypothetical protein
MIADLSQRRSLLMYQFMLARDAYGTTTESELAFASVKIIWRAWHNGFRACSLRSWAACRARAEGEEMKIRRVQ